LPPQGSWYSGYYFKLSVTPASAQEKAAFEVLAIPVKQFGIMRTSDSTYYNNEVGAEKVSSQPGVVPNRSSLSACF
jgi:hypothetical protein